MTARQDRRVLAAIDKDTWQPFPYRLSTPGVCGADIAETVLFARQRHPARPLGSAWSPAGSCPTPGSQPALSTTWDYPAVTTDRDLPLAEVEADHRTRASSRASPS